MADHFEKVWERQQRLLRHNETRGSKFPPFSIEPVAHERQRLAGKGMTAETRALRKQWVQDQILSPNEPRVVPELDARNPIRRAGSAPWNFIFKLAQPFMSDKAAMYSRFYVPKAVSIVAVLWFGAYWLKYNQNDWTKGYGWHSYTSKPTVFPGEASWPKGPQAKDDDFFDKGFKSRDTHKDLTSASPLNRTQ